MGLDSFERMMDTLADSLKKDFPVEGYVVMVSGKRAMIDLGRTNGVEPGMRFFALRKGAPVRHPITGKMLAGEDVKIGEMVIQTVERESSWAEIAQEETGVKISAGSLAKQVVGEKMPAVTAPLPATPALKPAVPPAIPGPQAPKMVTGKGPGGKILVQWASARDLILGDRDGFVTLYLNIGTQESPPVRCGYETESGREGNQGTESFGSLPGRLE